MSHALPLRVFRGESKTFRFTVVDLDSGARVNLTGATIQLQVRASDGAGGAPLVSKSIGSGITLRDQRDAEQRGQYDVAFDAADTAAIAAGTYRYDCAVREVDGFRFYAAPPADFYVVATVNPGV